MSEFWNNNKDTIGAGLKTVGKYSYKSTKFVAKTGYQAGKSHYQNSKAKREGRSQEGSDDSGQTTPNVHINYKDPSAFPPPPVKPGQLQYHGSSGNSANGSSATIPTLSNTNNTAQLNEQPYMNQINSSSQIYSRPQMAIPEQQVAIPEQQMNSTTLPSQPQMAVPSQQEHIHIQPSNPQQLPSNYKPQEQYLQSEQLNISDRHAPQPMERPAMPLPQHGNVPPLTTENVHPNIEADISSPAVGPQFEVKPYDWEEQKTTKIEIPRVDLTSIPPPPTHRDRNTSRQGSNSTPPSRTHTGNNTSTASVTTTGIVDGNLESNQEHTPKPAILGEYDDTLNVAYAPPPKPFRRATNNSSDLKLSGAQNTKTPPPPVVLTNKSAERPNSSNVMPSLPLRQMNTKANSSENLPKAKILGEYETNVDVGFAPPPRPTYRKTDTEANPPNRPLSRSTTEHKMSSISRDNYNSIKSSSVKPPVPKRNTGEREGAQELKADIAERSQEITPTPGISGIYNLDKKIDFAPPPKPFRRAQTSSDIPQKSSLVTDESNVSVPNKSQQPMQEKDSIKKATPLYIPPSNNINFPPPPKPHNKSLEESHTPSNKLSEKPKPPKKPEQLKDLNLSTQQADKNMKNKDQLFDNKNELLSTIKNKKRPAPIPKPKPKSLTSEGNHMNLNTEKGKETTIEKPDESKFLPISSFPPPPKPFKREELSKEVVDSVGETADFTKSKKAGQLESAQTEKSNSKGKAPPPVPKKRNAQSKSSPSPEGSEDNPFSKYLKDAVPNEPDRLHK